MMKSSAMLALGFALAGCDPSPACDEGQRAEIGSCIPLAKDARVEDVGGKDAGRTSHDAAAVAALDAGCSSGPGRYEGFGDPCTKDSDCSGCAAPTCASSPLNMCSRLDCQTDAEACPPDWQCTDISAFSGDPSITHICLKM
jgi:hypothetical protein